MTRTTLTLTALEESHLAEAIRLAQQASCEGTGRHDPVLARIQRKIGELAGCGED